MSALKPGSSSPAKSRSSASSSPSASRSLTPRPSHTSTNLHNSHSSTPGIIHLPQSTNSSTPRHSHSQQRHAPASPATLPAVAQQASTPTKRRSHRGNKSTAVAPVSSESTTSLQPAALITPSLSSSMSPAPSTDSTTTTIKSPASKSRRSRPRNHRQTSPPLPPTGDSPPPPSAPSTEHLSKSAPPSTLDLPFAATYQSHPMPHQRDQQQSYDSQQSSSDEWDMPSDGAGNKGGMGNLTWQQESLGRLTSGSGNGRNSGGGGGGNGRNLGSRREGGRQNGGGGGGQHLKPHQRPPLPGSLSDSTTPSSGAGGLTWQQELLQQSDSAAESRFGNASPVKGGSGTPAKLRRQQQKDSETFGLSDLSLDFPSQLRTPPRQASSPRQPQQLHHSISTPTKPAGPVEPRYAGPTFHNSPLPSSLPTPSFLLRRRGMEVGGASV